MDNVMKVITKHILETKYENLPAEVVKIIKTLFIDTIAVTIAGSSADGSEKFVNLIEDWGGKQESTILVYGKKVPIYNAALVNSTMARALDFEDGHEAEGGHLGATFMPGSLILAEYVKRPITGKDVILGIAVGSDVAARLRLALTTSFGWTGETFAPFGVVAMAAKFLGFDENQIVNGMGLAYTQCSCNFQGILDGAFTLRLGHGLGVKAGMLATVLAQNGFTGARNAFEGTYGFYPLYGRNQYKPEVITNELGKRFEVINTSFKPYPCCKACHIPIYATLEMMRENNVDTREIKKITVFLPTKLYNLTGFGDNKYRPITVVDAQFSMPYTVACAAVKKKVFIDEFTEASIRDSEVLEFAQKKVEVKIDPELDKIFKKDLMAPNRIELETKGGKHYSKYVEFIKGHPRDPMTWDDCVEKFYKCLPYSARPLKKDKITELVRLVKNLEEVDDVRKIVKLLVP